MSLAASLASLLQPAPSDVPESTDFGDGTEAQDYGNASNEASYDEDLAEREPLPYRDALYDVEKGLAFLRNGHYTAAADFASALNPRGDDDLENRSPEFGPGGRNPAAPDFYDVGTEAALAAMAYPRGGGRQIIPIPHDACFC